MIGTDAVVTAKGGKGGDGTSRWPAGGNGGNSLYSCTVQGGLLFCTKGNGGEAGGGLNGAIGGRAGGPGYSLKDCTVTGGSVKHDDQLNDLKNEDNAELLRGTLTVSDVTSVSVDGIPWYIPGNHADGNELYLYMTREEHQVQVHTKNGEVTTYTAEYVDSNFKFTEDNTTQPTQKPNVSVSLNEAKVTYVSEDLVEVTVEIVSSTNRAAQSRAIMDSVLVTVTGEDGRQISVRQYAKVQNSEASVSLDVSDYPAGTYTVTVVYGSSADLTEAEGTAELEITKKEVTASINSSTTTKIYDGTTDAPSGLKIGLTGVVLGDDVYPNLYP